MHGQQNVKIILDVLDFAESFPFPLPSQFRHDKQSARAKYDVWGGYYQ